MTCDPIARILTVTLAVSAIGQKSLGQTPSRSTSGQVSGQASARQAITIKEWTRAKDWTLAYIAKMPDEHLGYRPVPEVRSFAEQMLHLAYWNFGFTAKCFGRKTPYQESELSTDAFNTKSKLTAIVAESYDFVISGLETMPDEQLQQPFEVRGGTTQLCIERLNDGYEHQTHHRGQAVLYLRLKGLEPPVEPF